MQDSFSFILYFSFIVILFRPVMWVHVPFIPKNLFWLSLFLSFSLLHHGCHGWMIFKMLWIATAISILGKSQSLPSIPWALLWEPTSNPRCNPTNSKIYTNLCLGSVLLRLDKRQTVGAAANGECVSASVIGHGWLTAIGTAYPPTSQIWLNTLKINQARVPFFMLEQ